MLSGFNFFNKRSVLTESANVHKFPEQAAVQQKKKGLLPSLGRAGGVERNEAIFLNGFSLRTLGKLAPDDDELAGKATDYTSIMPLHPYFLKSGENRLQVFTAETSPDTPSELTLTIAEWDYVYGKTLEEIWRQSCLVLPFESQQPENACVFSWDGSLPQWAWQQGVALHNDEETKQKLYQEAMKIHKVLGDLAGVNADDKRVQALKKEWKQSTAGFIEASEWRGKPYVFIDQVFEAATRLALPQNDFGTLELQALPEPDSLQLEIFAGGTLAKLHGKYSHPLFHFTSNLSDGPDERVGDAKLSFDLWYRKASSGQWELDAVYPRTAPNTWGGFLMNFNDLENLFRLTNF